MEFAGLQKLTLLDYPGRVACTLFTQGCNYACPFCHNAALIAPRGGGMIPEEEVLAFLRQRQGLLDGVCVTGGEPLLQPGLADFLRQVRRLGYLVKLDTNGSNPRRLSALLSQKLVDYVAMDIKHAPARWGEAAGRPGYGPAAERESAALLMRGEVEYEFRTTVVQELHAPEDFAAIGEWLAGAQQYFLQPFAESSGVLQPSLHSPGEAELQACLAAVRPFIPAAALRGV